LLFLERVPRLLHGLLQHIARVTHPDRSHHKDANGQYR
jgi:hypothetical protein